MGDRIDRICGIARIIPVDLANLWYPVFSHPDYP
jgi:hypothetical protein